MSKSTDKTSKPKKEKSEKKQAKKVKTSEADIPAESVSDQILEPVQSEPEKPAKSKKEKKEKKAKKEVPDTEVPAVDESATDNSQDTPSTKNKSSKKRKALADAEEDSTAESTTNDVDALPSSTQESSRPNKKHKSILPETEILVDVTAPEPPSKKALRLLKKGKPLPPSKSGADPLGTLPGASETSTTAADKAPVKEVEKRSAHGIWIGNLPWSVTTEMLQNFFVENAQISLSDITRIHMPSPDDSKPANRVSTDVQSWKRQHNKGFAYVDFALATHAEEAVTLSEQLLQGRRVLIKNNKSFDGRPMKPTGEDATSNPGGKEPSKRIFIGNLRFDATQASIASHFEQCGPIEDCMLATFEDSGKCKGYGWITFETLEAADQAVKGWVPYYDTESESESSDESSDDSDYADDSSAEDNSDSEADSDVPTKSKPKKTPKKTPRAPRRRYIDKIAGRPVRREFAEPPQVRYKKRYGKDGTKAKALMAAGGAGGADGAVTEKPKREKPAKEYESLGKSYAPRLTGAIRKAEGKKVTF